MGYIGNQQTEGFSQVPAKQDLTGSTGGTLTLTHAVSSPEAIDLYINHVRQEPTSSYSIVGTTVTLNGYTVAATDDIYVVYNSLALQTSVVPDASVSTAKIIDGSVTSAKLDTNISIAGDLTVDTTTLKVDSTNNRVGIGTAPTKELDVAGNAIIDQGSNGGNTLSLDRTSASGTLGLFYNGTQGGLIETPSNGGFNFYVGSTPALMMSVNNIGSMELGNRSYGSGGYGTVLSLRYAGGGTQYGINFLPDADSAQACSFFNASGTNVGSITVHAGSTQYATSSDYRLKTAVNYDWDATTRLKQLRPARFEWIAEGDNAVPVDGFLAHEVQDIVPESISGTKDAVDDEGNPVYQGIDQSKLVPLLVKTIQELETRITALEAN